MTSDLNKPIPLNQPITGWKEVIIEENNEPLVALSGFAPQHITVYPQYFKQQIEGALSVCYCRKSVANQLLEAAQKLPDGYKLVVWDAYRPLSVQAQLYEKIVRSLKEQNSQITQNEIEGYISVPSDDKSKPSPHSTGGSIDLTICDDKGVELDMGTDFDSFSEKAYTSFYEEDSETSEEILTNRRLLYNVMITAGFTNLPTEWWHFDYGNQLWAKQKNTTAFYSIIEQLTWMK